MLKKLRLGGGVVLGTFCHLHVKRGEIACVLNIIAFKSQVGPFPNFYRASLHKEMPPQEI